MSDTKPLPDDPDRTAATPGRPDPAATNPAPPAPPAVIDPAPPVATASPAPPAATAQPAGGAQPAAGADPAAGGQPATTAQPAAAAFAAEGHAGPVGPGRLRTAGGRLTHPRARIPLLVGAVMLVLGCCLGGGVVALGAFVLGDGHRGDERGRITHDERGPRGGPAVRGDRRDGERIRPGDGNRRRPSPAATQAPPTAVPPTAPPPVTVAPS
jgi:hypothetical protein